MGLPQAHTPRFYVHDRVCSHCGVAFEGFARSKYCSPRCQEMAKRLGLMTAWGVPEVVAKELTRVDK